MFFEVPEPKPARWYSQYIPRASSTPAIDALESNAHDIVPWERLVEEGLTSSRLLECDPRAVAAWVRASDGTCITLAHIRSLSGGAKVTAEDVLRRWGDRLCPAITNAMQLDQYTTPEIVAALSWAPERWNVTFGKVPQPPTAPQPQRDWKTPETPVEKTTRGRASIGTKLLKL